MAFSGGMNTDGALSHFNIADVVLRCYTQREPI
jgi:hypothetical protein